MLYFFAIPYAFIVNSISLVETSIFISNQKKIINN